MTFLSIVGDLISLAKCIIPGSGSSSTILQREGQHVQRISILVSGFADICKRSVDGWEGTIRLIRPGEFYGEDAVTSENAHSSVEAFDDVFLYLIDSDDFKVCLVEHPRLALALIRALSGTIRQLCLLLIEESG